MELPPVLSSASQSSPVVSQSVSVLVPSPIEQALKTSRAFLASCAVYGDVLDRLVFLNPPHDVDKKELLRLKRCLRDDETFRILLFIWKESDFISDADLKNAGLSRVFEPGTLNAWNSATKTALSNDDLAKTNSRIRNVAHAAEKFGLIERGTDGRRRPLAATDLLHRLVLEVTRQQQIIHAETPGRPLLPHPSPNPRDVT